MATILSRKFFSRRVEITGGAAISYASLMRSAPAVTGTPQWGENADGSPSMDSFAGGTVALIPVTAVINVGFDAQVDDADTASSYTGVPVAAAQVFNVPDFVRGPVDSNHIWLFSATTQLVDLIFQGY